MTCAHNKPIATSNAPPTNKYTKIENIYKNKEQQHQSTHGTRQKNIAYVKHCKSIIKTNNLYNPMCMSGKAYKKW